MKKLIILLMAFILVGCGVKNQFDGDLKSYISDDHIDLSDVDPIETTYDELITMFGLADSYYYGDRQLNPDDLPTAFYMSYHEGVTFWIRRNKILEMRITDANASFDEKLYIGQSFDKALEQFETEKEYADGIHLYWKQDVVYTNLKGSDDNIGYYHDSVSNVRFWTKNEKISTIYYSGNPVNEYKTEEKIIGYADTVVYHYFGVNSKDFEDDPLLRGSWIYVDQVFDLDEFDVGTKRSTLVFNDLDIKYRGVIDKSNLAWTKGEIVNMFSPDRLRYTYSFKELKGQEYLVLEQEGYEKTYYFIFEKVVK